MTTFVQAPGLSPGRLATLVASRFVLNTVFRVAYPLVPFIALRFGASDRQATWIVTIQVVFGLVSPLSGWLGERIGLRTTMLIGLGWAMVGALGVALAPSFALLVAAFGACGIGVGLYQPAMQAYVSALTSFAERGRAVGTVELSWALSGMLGVPPLLALIQAQNSVIGAFVLLGGGLGAIMVLTLLLLPHEPTVAQPIADRSGQFKAALRNPNVLGFLLFLILAVGGFELLFVVQAPWSRAHFNADLPALGWAAFVFGVGELLGSSASALLTDRLGKQRATLAGFAVAASIYLALPALSATWPMYLVCYLLLALSVEFGIVASLTLASTISVVGRASVMALTVTAFQLSRVIGSRLGVPILEGSSIYVNSAIAATLTLVGIVIALRWVHEQERIALSEAS